MNKDNTMNPIFEGRLKEDVFESDIQRCSYLVGVFTRYGSRKDGTCVIRLANSKNKMEVCKTLLKELGCEEIQFESKESIPRINTLSFTPVGDLKIYLQRALDLRKHIKDKWALSTTASGC